MCDLRLKPDFSQSFVSHIESDGKLIIIWAQKDIKQVFKYENLMYLYFRPMLEIFLDTNRVTTDPIVDKYYIYCDVTDLVFYRVLVSNVDLIAGQSLVLFIDFGNEKTVPNDTLFVFEPMFIDCRPLAQKFVLTDIQPKNHERGFNGQRVVDSLQRFIQKVVMIAVFAGNRIKIYDNFGEEVIKTCLRSEGFDDIIITYDNSSPESDGLIAIDFDNDYESQRNSSSVTTYKSSQSVEQLSEVLSTVPLTEEKKSGPKELKLMDVNGCVIETNGTLDESVEDKQMLPLIDKTDKKSITFHLKTLFGPKVKVYITKTFSEKSIFVQLKDSCKQIEEMGDKLNDKYEIAVEDNLYPIKVDDIKKDLVVAALFTEDHNWYRASIVDISKKKKKVKVFYIDFGNIETIGVEYCRYLTPEFRELSPQAIHCRPLNKFKDSVILELFETNGIEIECEFVAHNNDIMDVRLYDNGVLLTSDSVPNSRKSSAVNSPKRVAKEPEVPKLEVKTTSGEEVNEKSEVSEQMIKNWKLSEELIKRNEEFVKSLVEMENKAVVSKANNTQSIYCQFNDHLVSVVEPLVEDMTDFYENQENYVSFNGLDLNEMKAKKTLIAAKCELTDKWLRAQVLSVNPEERVELFFVDFGTTGTVDYKVCRHLTDIYFRDVFQAIHCRPVNKQINYLSLKNLEASERALPITFYGIKGNVLDVLLKL